MLTAQACYTAEGRCDRDVTVRYALGGRSSVYFEVEPEQGVITTRHRIDSPLGEKFNFSVRAIAEDHFREAEVIVEVSATNQIAPRFPQNYTSYIYRGVPRGTVILTVQAFDNDDISYNRQVFYYLHTPRQRFRLGRESGKLVVDTEFAPLERTLAFLVFAYNDASPRLSGSARVTIELSDLSGE